MARIKFSHCTIVSITFVAHDIILDTRLDHVYVTVQNSFQKRV